MVGRNFLFLRSIGDWTQSLAHAKQVLYSLSHTLSHSWFVFVLSQWLANFA
jgi:hypothetical protein